MKKNIIIRIICSFIPVFLYSICLMAAQTSPDSIAGVKMINLNADELKNLGVVVRGDRIEYIEQKHFEANDEEWNSDLSRKVIILRNGVGARNYEPKENENTPKFYPRLAVNVFESGSAVYYSRLEDFEAINERHNNEDVRSTRANTYAGANNLVAVHFVFEAKTKKNKAFKNDVYLWYESSPELIASLPKAYSDKLVKEQDTILLSTDSTESRFTDSYRENSLAITSTQLYPNPATGDYVNFKFNISDSRIVSISLYDVNGHKVQDFTQGQMMQSGEHVVQLQLNNLTQGMYLVAIVTEKNEKAVQRLIIAKE